MSLPLSYVDPPSYLELISAIKDNDINRLHHILQQEKFTETHDIDQPVMVNYPYFTTTTTALRHAFDYGSSTAIITSLLEYGADPNRAVHCYGLEPVLSLACRSTHYEKIQLLLQYKADVHQCSSGQHTPIFSLCYVKDTEMGSSIETKLSCFRLLFEHGADVNHRNYHGLTLLYKVCQMFVQCSDVSSFSQSYLSILRLLVEEYHADVNIPSLDQMTPLFYLIAKTYTLTPHLLEAMRLLLQYHADVTIQCTRHFCLDRRTIGDTMLHCAIRRNQMEVVQLIIGEYYHPRLFTICNKGDRENVWELARRLGHDSIIAYFQTKLRHECYKFLLQARCPIR